jgi:hypothetical protein
MNKELILLSIIGSIAFIAVVNAAAANTDGVASVDTSAVVVDCQQGYY